MTLNSTVCMHLQVRLIEEHNTRHSSATFAEDVMDVGFRFTKPHCQELRALDADEIGITFICDGLGEQGLTGTRRTI